MKPLTALIASLIATLALSCAGQTSNVQKGTATNELTGHLHSGAKTIKISAAGTLEFASGFTLTGANVLRAALDLEPLVDITPYTPSMAALISIAGEPPGNVPVTNGLGAYYAVQTGTLGLTLLQISSEADARAALGLVIGTHVQAYDADLSTYAAITPSANVQSLLGAANFAAAVNLLVPSQTGNSGKFLTTNGSAVSWGDAGGGITIGDAITGGTSGRLLTSGATLGELTPGSGVLTWLGTPSKSNLNAAVSDDDPAYVGTANTFSESQTIATGKGLYLGTSYWRTDVYNSVFVDANLNIGYGSGAGNGFSFWNGGSVLFGKLYSGLTGYVALSVTRDHVLDFRDSVSDTSGPVTIAVYNEMSSVTSWTAGVMDWGTTTNTLRVGTDVGSGGGTARDVHLIRGGVVKVKIEADKTENTQPVKLPSYIVSGLPSAATCGAGAMAFVTDATATTAYTTVSGGGGNKVLVVSDGTNWIVH